MVCVLVNDMKSNFHKQAADTAEWRIAHSSKSFRNNKVR